MLSLIMDQEPVACTDMEFERLVDSLLSVLNNEAAIYDELLTTIREERRILKKPTLELLSASNNKKETCLLKARMLEEVRGTVIKKLARQLDREDSDINISLLASLTKGTRADALMTLRETLLSLVSSVREANEQNRDLLSYSLSYVKNSLNFINNLLSNGADYVSSGKLNASSLNGRILCREG